MWQKRPNPQGYNPKSTYVRKTRNCEQAIVDRKQGPKDNSTYMHVFPLQKSLKYMQDSYMPTPSLAQIPTTQLIQDQQLIENIRNMIKFQKFASNSKIDVSKYVTGISSAPIVAKKINENIELGDFKLDEQDVLPVCEEKVFVLKSYCNYLIDEQIQKSMIKIRQRNENLEAMLKAQKQQSQSLDLPYKSKYLQQMNTIKQQPVILDPKHVMYNQKIPTFQMKQKTRLAIAQGGYNNIGSQFNYGSQPFGGNYGYQQNFSNNYGGNY